MRSVFGATCFVCCAVFGGSAAPGRANENIPYAAALVLIASQGTLVRSDQDIGSVLVADPEIANVQIVSSRTIFVFGKSPGSTELFMLDGDDQVISRTKISIARPLSAMPRDY
ncbi:MAG: pilus assembly protein N-terminal domain-containing protein [Pseudomonadota bacterium]